MCETVSEPRVAGVTEKSLDKHNYVIKQLLCVQHILKCESVFEPGVAGSAEKSIDIHNYVIKQLLCVQQIVKCESVFEWQVTEIFKHI